MICYFPEAKLGGGDLYLYGDEDDEYDDQDVIFDQLDATTGMGTETFAIVFVSEESILHAGGV